MFDELLRGQTAIRRQLQDGDIALYDIDPVRLEESKVILSAINKTINAGRATVRTYLGVENRREALRGADFVVNAIQVGFYDPCTIIDFEVPKKCGLRRTVAGINHMAWLPEILDQDGNDLYPEIRRRFFSLLAIVYRAAETETACLFVLSDGARFCVKTPYILPSGTHTIGCTDKLQNEGGIHYETRHPLGRGADGAAADAAAAHRLRRNR